MNQEFKITIEHNGKIFGTKRTISGNLATQSPEIQIEQLDFGIGHVRAACVSRLNLFITLRKIGIL